MSSFIVENILTWGLVQDQKYGGYKLPVSFKKFPSIEKEIQKKVKKFKTNPVFYGDSKTVYFKVWSLSEKQKLDLLGKGRMYIDLQFEMEEDPIESKSGNLYLKFTVTGLRKNSKMCDEFAPKEEF